MARAVRGQQGQAGGARDWERTGGADCALFLQPEHQDSQPGGLPPCPHCCYMDCGKWEETGLGTEDKVG